METTTSIDPLRTAALAVVREAHPQAGDFGVTTVSDQLLAVTFRTPGGPEQENYVHFTPGGPLLYRRADELLRQFAGGPERSPWLRLAGTFSSLGGIAGLIALIIAATICYAFTRRPEVQVPEFLTHILTSFISFYMGHKFSQKT